jgi:hypothetical protein
MHNVRFCVIFAQSHVERAVLYHNCQKSCTAYGSVPFLLKMLYSVQLYVLLVNSRAERTVLRTFGPFSIYLAISASKF